MSGIILLAILAIFQMGSDDECSGVLVPEGIDYDSTDGFKMEPGFHCEADGCKDCWMVQVGTFQGAGFSCACYGVVEPCCDLYLDPNTGQIWGGGSCGVRTVDIQATPDPCPMTGSCKRMRAEELNPLGPDLPYPFGLLEEAYCGQ